MTFNLLDEKWIPVLYANGRAERVGIREALTNAGRIRQIAASNPMDNVALLRFLLAVLYWCKGNPPQEGSATPADPFPVGWFSKLDANRDCFNLLGEGKRFYQDSAAQRERAVTDLVQEIPTGNNFWHFRHSTDYLDGICRACSAMGLLRLPLFSVSGLPDLKAGINGTPPVYVVPWGKSLSETLLANWSPGILLGTPAWVQPDIRLTLAEHVPLLTGLTLLSRRVWLHDPSEPPGLCISCGAKENTLIRTCEFQTAGDQKNDFWHDPHVVYSDGKPRKASKAADMTAARKFRMDRPWPDLFSRIVQSRKFGNQEKPILLLIVGFATDQAKNIDVWQRIIALPSVASLQEASPSLLEQWQKRGDGLTRSLIRIVQLPNEKSGSREHSEILPIVAAIRPHVEHIVSASACGLLAGGIDAWERAAAEYNPMMTMVAKSLFPGFTTAAFQRRQQIAKAAPAMRPIPDSAKKTRSKRGEKK